MIALFLACEEAPEPVPDFAVIGVSPDDGGVAVEVDPVFLRLNAEPDMDRCNTDTIELNAINDDGSVAFPVPAEVSLQEEEGNIRVAGLDAFLNGWTYAVTVMGGENGCADVDGRPITAFLSTFEVP